MKERSPAMFRLLVLVLAALAAILAVQQVVLRARLTSLEEQHVSLLTTFDNLNLYEANLVGVDSTTGQALPITTKRIPLKGDTARGIRATVHDDHHINFRWIGTGPMELLVSSPGYDSRHTVIGSNLHSKITVTLEKSKQESTEQ